MKKRLMSFLLCLAMCAALLPVSAQSAEAVTPNMPEAHTEGDVWDGTITQPTTLVEKDGVYYYEITKCSELAYVAQMGGDWMEYNYILGNNLILNDVELTWDEEGNCTNKEALFEWIPIYGFSGTFEGNDYTISGLYINQPYTSNQPEGLFSLLSGNVHNLHLSNSYVSGKTHVGGIAGRFSGDPWIEIRNCSVDGLVKGYDYVGGIVGNCDLVRLSDLTNYAQIIGNGVYTAGIAGYGLINDLLNCTNYGMVTGEIYVAGIVGYPHFYKVKNCINYGSVSGSDQVGGIVAYASGTNILECSNIGRVTGTTVTGGILGGSKDSSSLRTCIEDCNNLASVTGGSAVGGIVGSLCWADVYNTYSIGKISGDVNVGGIVGKSDHIWGRSTLTQNYYIANDLLSGCGNAQEDIAGQFEAKTEAELKVKETYSGWNFNKVWSISADKNSGYPYLQWQESMLSDIGVNGVEINETIITLSVGDYEYLTATVFPANANNQSVAWNSSESDVASVSAAGKVTAVSPGTAVITATTEDGGFTAACTVTVTARSPEEYKINSITVRNNDGAALSEIPDGSFLATVSITNLASGGNTLILLCSYTSAGQYQGMMWISVEDLPVGATIKLTLPVDNSDGKIANLSAFVVSSLSELIPLGKAVSFLP